jgi:hypothetical protein
MKKKSLAVLLTGLGFFIGFFGARSVSMEKANKNLQRQLIAVCGAVDEALKEAGIAEKDFVIFPRSIGFDERKAISISLKGETRYTVFKDGRVIIIKLERGWEGQAIHKTWEDYPDFHSIGKK